MSAIKLTKSYTHVITTSTDVLSTGAATGVLKFDTQAQDTILCDPRFFPDGVDSTHLLELLTIVPNHGGEKATTQARRTA